LLDGELMCADENDSSATSGDSLDHVLREARWPAAAQPTVARLTQHWEKVRAARRRREVLARRAAALALAATLLGAATIGWLRLRPEEKSISEGKRPRTSSPEGSSPVVERRPVVTKGPQSIDTAHHETRRPTTIAQTVTIDRANGNNPSSESTTNLAPSRPPNEVEELMLAAADRTRKRSSASTKIAKHEPRPDSMVRSSSGGQHKPSSASDSKTAEAGIIAAAVKSLVSEKEAGAVAEVAARLRKSAPRHEEVLLAMLDRVTVPEQIVVLRLLAEIGGQATVGPALHAAESPALHQAAIETLSRLADASLVSRLALTEQNAEIQQALLATLLARGEAVSLWHYLSFVEDDRTTERALSAAQSVQNAPMDLLFSALSEPLETRRIAAARVIGRIDGTATTRRLITMVELGINRHEACIALLSSRGEEAVRYVGTAAERDPTLAAILSGARLFASSDHSPGS
jgi:hypothetical protein